MSADARLRELSGSFESLRSHELLPRHGACLLSDLADDEEKLSGPCPLRATALRSRLERFHSLEDSRSGHGLSLVQMLIEEKNNEIRLFSSIGG